MYKKLLQHFLYLVMFNLNFNLLFHSENLLTVFKISKNFIWALNKQKMIFLPEGLYSQRDSFQIKTWSKIIKEEQIFR